MRFFLFAALAVTALACATPKPPPPAPPVETPDPNQPPKCEGFSNLKCPEGMVCKNDRAATCDDCEGICVTRP